VRWRVYSKTLKMNQNRLTYLLKQYAAGKLTGGEQQELARLLTETDREELAQYITTIAQQNDLPRIIINEERSATTFRKIMAADKPASPAIDVPWWRTNIRRLSIAASLLLSVSATIYFISGADKKNSVADNQVTPVKPEKPAGRNTAVLYLADNSVVELDSVNNGLITTQGGSQVMLANGQLAYVAPDKKATSIAYNKITTPRGGEYSITLSDGTKVWLNAASSLKFPTAFTGEKREVELTGEAYMDVTKDPKHPFEVKIGNVNVAVHGTEFNIMGYEDENQIVTTLVSGSVAISANENAPLTLVPGEHAVVKNNNNAVFVEKADVEEETAWKNGRTYFNGANIKQIMRQIARWYDVDVQYKGDVANLDFTCTVSRKDKLSKLLGLMELTGAVHFTMQGNTIIVQP
jgi:transmembrane sensor